MYVKCVSLLICPLLLLCLKCHSDSAKPRCFIKTQEEQGWPGFKQHCSWDLLHFRQAALSLSRSAYK